MKRLLIGLTMLFLTTPLFMYSGDIWSAFREDDLATLQKYIDIGTDVNLTNKSGESLLYKAIYFDKINIVKYLLSKKANPNILNREGRTPLQLAMEIGSFGDYQLVELLLENGADLTAALDKDHKKEKNLLNYACWGMKNYIDNEKKRNGFKYYGQRYVETVVLNQVNNIKALEKYNDKLTSKKKLQIDNEMYSVGYYVIHDNVPKINEYMKSGEDISQLVVYGCFAGSTNYLKELYDLKLLDREKVDNIYAYTFTYMNSPAQLEILLNYGANPEILNPYGFNAIQAAVKAGYKESVQFLLKHGSDPLIQNTFKKTAFDYTTDEEMIALLKSYNTSTN